MFKRLLSIRYIIILAVCILLLNSVFFIVAGTLMSLKGYTEYIQNGLMPSDTYEPGMLILKGLDAFMLAIIFIIFGLGIARLFLFNSAPDDQIPSWLRFHEMKGLKVLLWETILVTLVIYCLQILLTSKELVLELLILPVAILLLTVALFFMRWREQN
jgi:uncharacterized membrane protein YqhA